MECRVSHRRSGRRPPPELAQSTTLDNCPEKFPARVFCTEAGTLPDESQAWKVMRKVFRAAGSPLHFSPHCLRHTFASLLLQEGESPAYVQRQLGHASIQLTVDTYGKWLPMGNKADPLIKRPSEDLPTVGYDELNA
jgi:integrase